MAKRHKTDNHTVEEVPELTNLVFYHGRNSLMELAYRWCPTCQLVFQVELAHATGITERKDWDRKCAASQAGMRERKDAARAYVLAHRTNNAGAAPEALALLPRVGLGTASQAEEIAVLRELVGHQDALLAAYRLGRHPAAATLDGIRRCRERLGL